MICPVCNNPFESAKKSKIFCSNKCRGINHRSINSEKVKHYNNQWRKDNPEKAKRTDYHRSYRESNRIKLNANAASWYHKNKDTLIARRKFHGQCNENQIKERQVEWRKKDKEKRRIYFDSLRKNLSNHYLRNLFYQSGIENPTPGMIEEKRLSLKIKRKIKQIQTQLK